VKEFDKLTGGLTNLLYKAVVGDNKVLVRINGAGTENIIDRDKETEYMTLLGEHKLSAKLHAIYKNGYVYDYIEGEPLKPEEMPTLSDLIAKKLADFHVAPIVPKTGDKSPVVFKTLKKWIEDVKGLEYKDDKKEKMKSIDLEKLREEVESQEQLVKDCDIGFCHNDLLSLNIIYDKEKKQVNFIDYEYCGYNYCAYDIGNHMCEHVGFELKFELFPDQDQQKKFASAYLEQKNSKKPTNEELEKFVSEVDLFANMSNAFWGVWALSQAYYSDIDFDYLDYGSRRIKWFYERRDQVVQEFKRLH